MPALLKQLNQFNALYSTAQRHFHQVMRALTARLHYFVLSTNLSPTVQSADVATLLCDARNGLSPRPVT
jgi:hypothetical protein